MKIKKVLIMSVMTVIMTLVSLNSIYASEFQTDNSIGALIGTEVTEDGARYEIYASPIEARTMTRFWKVVNIISYNYDPVQNNTYYWTGWLGDVYCTGHLTLVDVIYSDRGQVTLCYEGYVYGKS